MQLVACNQLPTLNLNVTRVELGTRFLSHSDFLVLEVETLPSRTVTTVEPSIGHP